MCDFNMGNNQQLFCNQRTNKKKYFVYAKIVSKSGALLSIGVNSYIKTNPLHVHAEVAAIAKLRPDQYKKAYAIYVYRFDNHGRPACAKPCKVCQALIREIGIKRVYYTMPDDQLDMSYDRYKRYNQRYVHQWCNTDCI